MNVIGKIKDNLSRSVLKDLVLETSAKWSQDNVPRICAAVSFYAALSLAPFLIIATVVAVYWLDMRPESRISLIGQARETFGAQAGMLLERIVRNAQERHTAGVVASSISFLIMFFSASNLFLQFDDSVRTIWGVKQTGSLVKLFVKSRLAAFGSVIADGISLITWLYHDSRMAYLAKEATNLRLERLMSFLSTIIVLTALCFISMKRPAGIKLAWSDVWPGALFASFSISCAKYFLSLYFANSGIDTVYGPAGAVVVILLWIYYCAQLYFFGAELVYIYAHRFGSLMETSAMELATEPRILIS